MVFGRLVVARAGLTGQDSAAELWCSKFGCMLGPASEGSSTGSRAFAATVLVGFVAAAAVTEFVASFLCRCGSIWFKTPAARV